MEHRQQTNAAAVGGECGAGAGVAGRAWAAPALLEGVWVLLAMFELLKQTDLNRLRQLAEIFFDPHRK